MHAKWIVCASVLSSLSLIASAGAQDQPATGQDNQNQPVLKTRPRDSQPPPTTTVYHPPVVTTAPPDALPEGKRFIIKLKDTLDTRTMEPGKHFKAELREDLITPSGLIVPKGRTIKGHVASFERGFTGARLMLAMDEMETRKGWVPLIATVTGVPGDSSIRSTGDEGELARKGPDKKRVITNVAIGAGVGAATGAAVGGSKGAAIGAAAGAGLGSGASLLFKGNDLKLDKGTQLEVRLDRDTIVPSH